MASSNHGGASQREPPFAAHSSDTDAYPKSPPSPPGYSPPQMMYYPSAMGYPPAGGPADQHHHAYPQGYAAYTNANPGGYHYPAAPYYGAPPTYRIDGPRRGGGYFFRHVILCLVIILTGIFLVSLVMALFLHPSLPVYKVVSMSVSNFANPPSLAGNWDTKLMIENPNDKLKVYFWETKVEVVYKDGIIAVNYAPDFDLDKNDEKELDVNGSSSMQANGIAMEKTTLSELGNDRANGTVSVALRVSSMYMFRSRSISTQRSEVVAICDGLKVVFQNNTETGTWDNRGKPIECLVYA